VVKHVWVGLTGEFVESLDGRSAARGARCFAPLQPRRVYPDFTSESLSTAAPGVVGGRAVGLPLPFNSIAVGSKVDDSQGVTVAAHALAAAGLPWCGWRLVGSPSKVVAGVEVLTELQGGWACWALASMCSVKV
jgi:hypothetical protein